MSQIHKQFSDDEVKQYLKWYEDKVLTKSEVLQALGIQDSRFYVLLAQEVDRYNNRQVHSTTKAIPAIRFMDAVNDGRTCFRPLDSTRTTPPVSSTKDIFCLRTERKVNGYGKISLDGNQVSVPGHLPDGTTVQLHIVPDTELTEVRFLRNNQVLGYQQIPTPHSLQF